MEKLEVRKCKIDISAMSQILDFRFRSQVALLLLDCRKSSVVTFLFFRNVLNLWSNKMGFTRRTDDWTKRSTVMQNPLIVDDFGAKIQIRWNVPFVKIDLGSKIEMR